MATAIAHPKVMTIQPEFSALEFLSSTPATTPSPRMMRIMVPINSARYACIRSPPSLEWPSGRDVAGRREVPLHLLVELEQRYGEAGHLERGHVVPDVGHPPHVHALVLEPVGHAGVGDVELHGRGAAHAVDHDGDLGAREVHGVAEYPIEQLVDDAVGGLYLLALDAWLDVDADAHLHLVVGDLEDGLPALGRGAAGQGHPHGADVPVDPLGELLDAGEVLAVVGRGAADLVHEDGARDPAPPAREGRVLDGHVVVCHDVVGLDALGLGQLSGHLEVEDVAGVVLDDVEDAGPAVYGLGGLEHLVGGRAGEHGARAGGVEHAGADVAAVGGLVAGAAAGDEGDLALHGGVGPEDDAVFGEQPEHAAVGELHTPEHLLDYPLRGIDELLHRFPFGRL